MHLRRAHASCTRELCLVVHQINHETPQSDGSLSTCSLPDAISTEPDMKCKSPNFADLHTFRDALNVTYQRMAITGEELSGVPLEDLKTASGHLIEALHLRSKYMERIGNQFPSTTRKFLSGYYPNNLPKHRVKNTDTGKTSFNPPDPPKDHWGKNTPLPKYEKYYKLRRHRGVTEILNEDGTIDEQFQKIAVTKEEFLNDTEKLTSMIVDGPL
ncbi:hypothetical protein CRE_09655 [Caenorhabditis remanei]|uniref:Uncharacterized protein n=1 Tax=Caenorhabditis remanei TaxID=31234 RepID=E3MX20_CAERE|nr:hypothetical protein CRE_09655 [Caenorhabditis remanei]